MILRMMMLGLGWLGGFSGALAELVAAGDRSRERGTGTLHGEGLDGSQPIQLRGSDSRHQLLVSRTRDDWTMDVTRSVNYRVEPAGVIDIDAAGFIQPLGNGRAQLTAEDEHGRVWHQAVEVVDWEQDPAVDFVSQVVPVFTKFGCNGGGCHGKAAGQNGFKLSLLGFEAKDDYARLVKESRGRRLSPAAPETSLLLVKATGELPHGGGARLAKDSQEYRLLRRWIAQGMPWGQAPARRVVQLKLLPTARRLVAGGTQQLSVQAVYSDGVVADVTRMAQYESNDADMAVVSESGLITVKESAGVVAVMARFCGQVATFQASVPLPEEVVSWPPPRNAIDQAVIHQLQSLQIPLAAPADDATYLRRLTLDLAGRLPTLEETRLFHASTAPDKRDQWLERLLQSDDHAEYFANKWMLVLRNRRTAAGQQSGTFALHRWLKKVLSENTPYDSWVRELLTASGSMEFCPPVAWYRNVPDTPARVEDMAQLFLGQRIQCARCHHHPYEKWSQEDYYRLSAFFSLVKNKAGSNPDEPVIVSDLGQPRAAHPLTGVSLEPAALDGPPLSIAPRRDPREALADWMAEPGNPFFAKALVNRYWKHFFGRGLVEPEDDLRSTNPPSNPELMEVLARHFIDSKFDLRELVRFICRSDTYRLGYEADGVNIADRKSFSRFYPKRLSAEVLLDCIDQVAQTQTTFEMMPAATRAVGLPDTAFNSYFLTVFGRPDAATACECERVSDATLAQSLQLANSKELQAKLAADTARPACLAQDTGRSAAEKIDELYLIAFSRLPSEKERQEVVAYLQRQTEQRAAYEDVLWAMINSKEFLFNH
jgi:hypothetical protein